jgi:glycerophosphoryl diester phosphodiesterase
MHKVDIQGHRGARGMRPENSFSAFDYATRIGVDTLELDVVISSDLQVIVSHDRIVSPDICSWPDGRPVSEEESEELVLFKMNAREIQRFDCGRRGNEAFPDQVPSSSSKPFLREVIREANKTATEMGRAPLYFNIETKSSPDGDDILNPTPDIFVDCLLQELSRLLVHSPDILTRCTIQSFDERTLRLVRVQEPRLTLSLLVDAARPGMFDDHIRSLGFTPDIYSPEYCMVTPDLVAEARDMGVRVLPWTVNSPEEMKRLYEMGVAGLITDYPERAVSLFRTDAQAAGR